MNRLQIASKAAVVFAALGACGGLSLAASWWLVEAIGGPGQAVVWLVATGLVLGGVAGALTPQPELHHTRPQPRLRVVHENHPASDH